MGSTEIALWDVTRTTLVSQLLCKPCLVGISQSRQKEPASVQHQKGLTVRLSPQLGNLSLYVAKLFSPFQCPNTYPVAISRIRNESVT